MKKMRINFVIPSTVLGGGVRMVFSYANYLASQGHDIVVYVPKIFAWEDIQGGKVNVKTSIANTFKRGTRVNWYDCHFPIILANRISDKYIRDADITVATAWYTARNVAMLSPSKGKKAYFIQDYEVCKDGTNRELVEATYSLGLYNVTIARWLDDIVSKITGYKTTVILNGIADEEFFHGVKKINNPKAIIMLGNMAEHKGTQNGIEVLKRMQEKYGVRVIIYAAVPSEKIPESFEFYCQPKREKLMQLYTEADICLFPSIREGWGLIVTEAMAHQCAVVGNRTGAVSEIGKDRENMMITPDMKIESLERCLEEVMNDDDLLTRIQLGGYETACCLKNSIQFRKFEECLWKIAR